MLIVKEIKTEVIHYADESVFITSVCNKITIVDDSTWSKTLSERSAR
jgi:hypothetical protein